MIRYRRLYESENSDIQMYDTVRCAGHEWYIIDNDGGIVTLLAKDNVFGESIFDEKSNDYKISKIRNYLVSKVLPRVNSANPIPTRLYDVGVTDKVWLLSIGEAEELPRGIRRFADWYWLRSRGRFEYDGAFVHGYNGEVNDVGYTIDGDSAAVRPAMRVNIKDLD